MQTEKWFTIPRYPTYEISDLLRVRHKKKLKIKSCFMDDGYLKLNITFKGNAHKPYLHQLVGNTFVPNPENKPELHHIDEDKLNNHWTNLMWVTRKEHRQISKENEQTSHKVSKKDVVFIRDNYSKENKKLLADKFGIRQSTVYGIAIGRVRSDVIGGKIHEPLGLFKKVINIETGEIYNGAEFLCKEKKLNLKSIRRSLSGERYNKTPYRYLGEEYKCVLKPKKPIAVFDMEWNFISKYDYPEDLAKYLNRPDCSEVYAFTRGESSHYKRLKFKLIDNDGNYIEPTPFVSKRPPLKPKKIRQPLTPSKEIIKYDLNGNRIASYSSVGVLSNELNKDKRDIRNAIRKSPRGYYKGFIYKYAV